KDTMPWEHRNMAKSKNQDVVIKTIKFNKKDGLDREMLRFIESQETNFQRLMKHYIFMAMNGWLANPAMMMNTQILQQMMNMMNAEEVQNVEQEEKKDELEEMGIDKDMASKIKIDADDDDW